MERGAVAVLGVCGADGAWVMRDGALVTKKSVHARFRGDCGSDDDDVSKVDERGVLVTLGVVVIHELTVSMVTRRVRVGFSAHIHVWLFGLLTASQDAITEAMCNRQKDPGFILQTTTSHGRSKCGLANSWFAAGRTAVLESA